MQGGAINRVLDFEIQEGDIFREGEGNAVVTVLVNNYGFAGRDFVETIQISGKDAVAENVKRYEKIIRDGAARRGDAKEEKQVTPLAIILFADQILEEVVFQDGIRLDLDYCLDNIKSKNQVSEMQRAYEHFLDFYSINKSKFVSGEYGDQWGAKKSNYICVVPTIMEKIANDYNFSSKQFIAWCKTNKLLECDSGRNTTKMQLSDSTSRVRVYKIKITDYPESQQAELESYSSGFEVIEGEIDDVMEMLNNWNTTDNTNVPGNAGAIMLPSGEFQSTIPVANAVSPYSGNMYDYMNTNDSSSFS
jgi:hypothetical protein